MTNGIYMQQTRPLLYYNTIVLYWNYDSSALIYMRCMKYIKHSPWFYKSCSGRSRKSHLIQGFTLIPALCPEMYVCASAPGEHAGSDQCHSFSTIFTLLELNWLKGA